jgi:hypothetical protein
LLTYKFVNSKDWVKLQLSFFSSSTLSSVYYMSMRFVVLTAAFQRIQVVCVTAVSLCEWFPTFRKWVLRSFETSGTTHQTTRRVIPENLSLIWQLVYTSVYLKLNIQVFDHLLTYCPVTQGHIPEDLNFQEHGCEDLISSRILNSLLCIRPK